MAITTTTEYEIDLCPIKPKNLELGDTRVKITITLVTEKKPADIVMTRVVDRAAAPTMERYQTDVQTSVNKLSAKVKLLAQMKDLQGAEDEANTVAHHVLGACESIQAAVDQAVKALVKQDAQNDQNLFEARVRVGIAFTFKTITIAVDATRIGLTLGADVHADIMIFKHCYDLCLIVYEQTKDETKLRKDLLKAYDAYIESRKLKEEAKTSTVAAVQRKFKQAASMWTSNASVAENARKRYRDEVTSMRQNLEKLSKRTAKASVLADTPDLKVKDAAGVRKKAGELTLKVNVVYQNLTQCEKFQGLIEQQLQDALTKNKSKTKIDNRTFAQRFPDVKTSAELLSNIKEMAHLAKELADLGTAVI